MDLEAFAKSPVGELVPIDVPSTSPGGEPSRYYAFVPTALPNELTIGLAAMNIANKASMAVARLDQAMQQLPDPTLLLRPIMRREAVSTSALEGTYAAFNDVLEADFLEEKQMSSEQRKIQNFVHAIEESGSLLEKYPISRRLIGALQKIIVRGTPGDTYESGDLRQSQVYIGAPGGDISEARFVPPPPYDLLETGFSDWEKWVSGKNDFPIVVRMALAHYQFETLHPYNDGNGRLGRLIALLQLVQDGVLGMPALNISPWFEERRAHYIDGLLEAGKTGNFDPWIEFFSTAVLEQAEEGVRVISDLLRFRDETIKALRSVNVRGSAIEIVEWLIGYPLIDVPTARRLTGKTFEAANQAIGRLVEHGVLREVTGKKMNRLFLCQRVISIVNRRYPSR